jgi:hypothetical protein
MDANLKKYESWRDCCGVTSACLCDADGSGYRRESPQTTSVVETNPAMPVQILHDFVVEISLPRKGAKLKTSRQTEFLGGYYSSAFYHKLPLFVLAVFLLLLFSLRPSSLFVPVLRWLNAK